MQSLAKTRVYQMAKTTGTKLTEAHLDVLEYAWGYYRERRVGPLFNNIRCHTGASRNDLETLFPNGLSSVYTWVGIPIQSTKAGCKPMALVEVDDPREVYLDNNATTPLRAEVVEALVDFFGNPRSFGNPSSSYAIGNEAFDVLDLARKRVARGLSVDKAEIYFTGSGSEANNLAIKGVAARHASGHIISSNVEHPSVYQTLEHLERSGYDVTYLPVAPDGTLTVEAVETAMRDDTILVCIMAANNEIGTLYPCAEIGALCGRHGIPFAVDAIQAFGKVPISPREAGIDILTISGHKIYAPKGVAAIYVNQALDLDPLIHGGSQENGLRSGTENVAGIMALGLAAKLACSEREEVTERFLALRKHFLARLKETVPGALVNGTLEHRLAHNLSIGFPGLDSGSLLLSLNQIGIYVSAGSACSAGDEKISHVLGAIGSDPDRYGTIRFSFGKDTSIEDIDYLFEHIPAIMDRLEEIRTGETTRMASD